MLLDNKKITLINQYFQDKPVTRAYLFGSYARNEADDKSDIDILVELDYSKRIGIEYYGMKIDLEKLLNHKVDVVSTKSISKYIKQNVEKEKILIYEK